MDFVVVDTEGKGIIEEIAIIDSSGDLIVEEFIDENLKDILLKIKPILESNLIVAHSATHDQKILKGSYRSIGEDIELKTLCTLQKAKKLLPSLSPHSLSILSTNLLLKDSDRFFDQKFAHRASYDAKYTYLLYRKLLSIENSLKVAKEINPFSSSKVDNPFQKHFDDRELYRDEFVNLLNIVDEIKQDDNAQSKTALVIGEAGNGKTHLMMRFLKSVSNTNRFLFVGKPNNKSSILFHTYTKILESFIQKIDDSTYSQLEYLLAKSFSAIIIELSKSSKVIDILKQNHLNIYEKFGRDGSDTKSRNWRSLEKTMLKWYRENHGSDPISVNILKALIKYTFYKDENKRDIVINYLSGRDLNMDDLSSVGLEPWSDINLEEFSLKAISLFGKLSIFDEPLIISFDQLEAMSSDEELLLNFGDSLKELITATPNSLVILNLFPNRWREYEALFDGSFIDLVGKNKIVLERPSASSLRTMLKQRALYCDIDLDDIFRDKLIYKDILQYNSIRGVLNRASDYFKLYIHDIPLPKEMGLSLEERIRELMSRVGHLESLHNIENSSTSIKIDFNIERYIRKIHSQKLKEYDRKTIIDDKQDIDKLKFILTSIDELYNFEIDFFKIKKVLPEHIIIKTDRFQYVVGFLHLEGRLFVSRIKNFNSLVANHPEYYFRLFRDNREKSIKGRVSKDEQLKLDNSKNGRFIMMFQDDRVIYETIYQLIIDLKNRDIDISLEKLMGSIFDIYKEFWLCKLLDN
jgi:DNA replication protein DnaC